MRLGEIKQIIDVVINEEAKIVIDHEVLYGGQAYAVSNFREIANVYEIISDFGWNDADNSQLNSIIEKYQEIAIKVQVDVAEFNILNTYIVSVNEKLPFFYSILESMIEDQDEQTINIKLPLEIESLSDLTEVNKRLEKTLKIFSIDGQFEFQGFDKGTMWYIVLPAGFLSYEFLVHGLDIAKRYFEAREAYYNSKKAELDYKASLADNTKYSEKEFSKYQTRRLDLMIKEEVDDAVNKLGKFNGKTKPETTSHLIKGVQALVNELGEGMEFHLSLNRPEYIEGSLGNLVIDYGKIQNIKGEKTKMLKEDKPKELQEPEKKENVE